MKTLKGRLTIGRWTGGSEDGGVRIELIDDLSGCRVVEIELSLADFATVLFGRAHHPCKYEWYEGKNVGMKREVKTVEVKLPKTDALRTSKEYAKLARKQIAQHEVDGWEGRDEDMANGHKINYREGTASVVFIRFVPAEEAPGKP